MNDVISSYSRAQAIDDGVLVDASRLATEAGFRYSVALTHAAWERCVAVGPDDVCQDETGRLWDILSVLRFRIQSGNDEQTVCFDVLVAKSGRRPQPIRLKCHCGPGDGGEPVLTIMLPEED